jgi:hypothetical protein
VETKERGVPQTVIQDAFPVVPSDRPLILHKSTFQTTYTPFFHSRTSSPSRWATANPAATPACTEDPPRSMPPCHAPWKAAWRWDSAPADQPTHWPPGALRSQTRPPQTHSRGTPHASEWPCTPPMRQTAEHLRVEVFRARSRRRRTHTPAAQRYPPSPSTYAFSFATPAAVRVCGGQE